MVVQFSSPMYNSKKYKNILSSCSSTQRLCMVLSCLYVSLYGDIEYKVLQRQRKGSSSVPSERIFQLQLLKLHLHLTSSNPSVCWVMYYVADTVFLETCIKENCLWWIGELKDLTEFNSLRINNSARVIIPSGRTV